MNGTKAVVLALMVCAVLPSAAAQDAKNGDYASVRIRYIVNDVPAAVNFYRDKLGFRLDGQSGPFFAALSRGGIQLLLSPTKGPGGASQPMPGGEAPAPGGWNRIVINTSDLKGEVEKLRKQGVHFRNDIVIGLGGNEILLDDPSGNVVELFQSTVAYQPR